MESSNHQSKSKSRSQTPFSNFVFPNLSELQAAHAPDSTLQTRVLSSPPSDAVAQQHRESHSPYSWSNGPLFYRNFVYLPKPYRVDVIEQHHDAPLAGHWGVTKIINLITHNYWFPSIKSLV
jgi:hypothetical protein